MRLLASTWLVPILTGACATPEVSQVSVAQDPPEQDAATQEPGAPTPQDPQQYAPPVPNPRDFDWIKLTSGEWLKGDIEYLRSEQLEFDSDELDTLTFDWEDVAELRSPRQNTIVLDNLETVTGTVLVRDGQVVMQTETGERRFTRDELLSLIPGDSAGGGIWSGNVTLGATVQSGNTNQTTTNALIDFRRRSPLSRLSLTYVSNFGELEGTTNVENQRFTGRWDLFTSERWFFTPANIDLYRDPFQNIALQFSPGAGFGYHAVDDPGVKWDLSLLGGWRYTEFDSVGASGNDDESTAQVTPGTQFEWDVTEKIEYFLRYNASIGVPDTRNTNQHVLTGISVDVWGDLDLDITFQWDRIGNPEQNADGTFPEKDDFRLSFGFGYSF